MGRGVIGADLLSKTGEGSGGVDVEEPRFAGPSKFDGVWHG